MFGKDKQWRVLVHICKHNLCIGICCLYINFLHQSDLLIMAAQTNVIKWSIYCWVQCSAVLTLLLMNHVYPIAMEFYSNTLLLSWTSSDFKHHTFVLINKLWYGKEKFPDCFERNFYRNIFTTMTYTALWLTKVFVCYDISYYRMTASVGNVLISYINSLDCHEGQTTTLPHNLPSMSWGWGWVVGGKYGIGGAVKQLYPQARKQAHANAVSWDILPVSIT